MLGTLPAFVGLTGQDSSECRTAAAAAAAAAAAGAKEELQQNTKLTECVGRCVQHEN
jgi:hypothetical protein